MFKMKRIVKDVDPEFGDVRYFRAGVTAGYDRLATGRLRGPSKGRRAAERRRYREYYASAPARPLFHTGNERPAYDDPVWQQLRAEVLSVGKCEQCGSKKRLTVDHRIPLSLGGHSFLNNLRCLCRRCNKAKGRLLPCDLAA